MTAARYDNLNDAGTAVNNTNAWSENLTYDVRGNITALTRRGKFKASPTATCWTDGEIDNLAYTYNTNTNRLQKIADSAPTASKTQGWNNTAGAATTAQYAYDANGNMTSDPYKGMTVTYNFMNLPTKFTFTGNKVIDVLYDGSGRKLRKTVTDNGTLQYRQDYVGGIEYRTSSTVTLSMESIYHAEGRVFNTNTGTTSADVFRYEYAIRDHLGNTRLTFTDKNADGKIDVTTTASNEILQENHYYPFGMVMNGPWMDDAARNNQYLYNGKELNDDFGLSLYDYGARWYDASLGRFPTIDRMSSHYESFSPYNYAKCSPITNADMNGDSVWVTTTTTTDAQGRTTVNTVIHITGKILDLSGVKTGGGGCTAARNGCQSLADGINKEYNSQSTSLVDANGQTQNISFDVNFTVAESMDDVGTGDHLLVVVDDVLGKADQNLKPGSEAGGLAELGGLIGYVKNRSSIESLVNAAVHELGHNLGLEHTPNGSGDWMSYDNERHGFTRSQIKEIRSHGYSGTDKSHSNRETSSTTTNNWFYHTSTNEAPYYKNAKTGEVIPKILRNNN